MSQWEVERRLPVAGHSSANAARMLCLFENFVKLRKMHSRNAGENDYLRDFTAKTKPAAEITIATSMVSVTAA